MIIDDKTRNINTTFQFKDENGYYIFVAGSGNTELIQNNENNFIEITCVIPANFFNQGTFYINCLITENKKQTIYAFNDALAFNINPKRNEKGAWMGKTKGALKPLFKWEKISK